MNEFYNSGFWNFVFEQICWLLKDFFYFKKSFLLLLSMLQWSQFGYPNSCYTFLHTSYQFISYLVTVIQTEGYWLINKCCQHQCIFIMLLWVIAILSPFWGMWALHSFFFLNSYLCEGFLCIFCGVFCCRLQTFLFVCLCLRSLR